LYRNVCILYTQYVYTLQVRVSTTDIVIGWSCQSGITCFTSIWELCVRFAWRFSGTYPWRKTRPACACICTYMHHTYEL